MTRVDIGPAVLLNLIQVEQIRHDTHRTQGLKVAERRKSAGGSFYGYRATVGHYGPRITREIEVIPAEIDIVLRSLRM